MGGRPRAKHLAPGAMGFVEGISAGAGAEAGAGGAGATGFPAEAGTHTCGGVPLHAKTVNAHASKNPRLTQVRGRVPEKVPARAPRHGSE